MSVWDEVRSNDVAFLLPGKMHAGVRKLKVDAPKASTDSGKRVILIQAPS